VAERITLRFPDGLTVFAGRGQWRGPDGRIVHEAARIVLIVTAATPEAVTASREIQEAYRRRFAQGAVGLVLQRSCALF
jgi:hypothetical protein